MDKSVVRSAVLSWGMVDISRRPWDAARCRDYGIDATTSVQVGLTIYERLIMITFTNHVYKTGDRKYGPCITKRRKIQIRY